MKRILLDKLMKSTIRKGEPLPGHREEKMAKVVVKIQAIGITDKETCAGCGQSFSRGEQMNAVEANAGEPLGWFCDKCITDWPRKSK